MKTTVIIAFFVTSAAFANGALRMRGALDAAKSLRPHKPVQILAGTIKAIYSGGEIEVNLFGHGSIFMQRNSIDGLSEKQIIELIITETKREFDDSPAYVEVVVDERPVLVPKDLFPAGVTEGRMEQNKKMLTAISQLISDDDYKGVVLDGIVIVTRDLLFKQQQEVYNHHAKKQPHAQ